MSTSVVVFVWVVSALIGAVIAGEKGRRREGLALGILLGPIGLLIALTMQSTPEVEAERRHAVEKAGQELRDREEPT